MSKNKIVSRLWSLIICILFTLTACTYPIKYRLNEADVVKTQNVKPLKVQVAVFADKRDVSEREKKVRKKNGGTDVNDYTYDKEFRGPINKALTEMLVKHLAFSQTFASIKLGTDGAAPINDAALNELAQKGIDAVITGEIENFYGYYDNNPGKQFGLALVFGLAFGIPVAIATTTKEATSFGRGVQFEEVKTNPIAISLATSVGTGLGAYLESTSKRNIERKARFSAKMLGTKNHAVLWEDTFVIEKKDFTAMPGLNTDKRKFEIAVNALREAVNQMVKSLEKAPLAVEN